MATQCGMMIESSCLWRMLICRTFAPCVTELQHPHRAQVAVLPCLLKAADLHFISPDMGDRHGF